MPMSPRVSKITLGERIKIAAAWFIVGGFVVALVTAIPAAIIGLHEIESRQLVSWSALVIGIGGAIYGRYPPPFSNYDTLSSDQKPYDQRKKEYAPGALSSVVEDRLAQQEAERKRIRLEAEAEAERQRIRRAAEAEAERQRIAREQAWLAKPESIKPRLQELEARIRVARARFIKQETKL